MKYLILGFLFLVYMFLMMYNKQHLISLLGYIGIGFIAGAISHGFFSGIRSIVMASIGIILFIITEFLKSKRSDDIKSIVFGSLIYSIAVGMVSGGLQHFLDSPERSLWIIPLGRVISTAIFPYKENLNGYHRIKSMIIGIIVSVGFFVVLYGLYLFLPEDAYQNHHSSVSTDATQIVDNHPH